MRKASLPFRVILTIFLLVWLALGNVSALAEIIVFQQIQPNNSDDSDLVTPQLQWFHQFQYADYYAAKEKGFNQDAGLNVIIREGGLKLDTVEEVTQNNAQYSANHSTRVAVFRKASLKGWQYAIQHPEELTKIIGNNYGSEKSVDHLRFEVKATKKLTRINRISALKVIFCQKTQKITYKALIIPDLVELGHMNKEHWQYIANVFDRNKPVNPGYSPDDFIYQPQSNKESNKFMWVTRVMFLIILTVGIIAIALYIFNKRLQKEIKEKKLSESAYKESEAKFRLLIDNAEILVTILDKKGICVLMNNKVAEYHGGKKEDFTNKSLFDLYIKDEAEIYSERIRQVINSEESRVYEDIIQFKTGARWLITNIQPLRNIHGKVYSAQMISQDITKRKQAEDDLKESEERYRAVSEITSDFAYGYELKENDELLLQWVTDAIVDITGYTLAEIRGFKEKWNSVVHPEDMYLIKQQFIDLKSKNSGIIEYRIIRKDGSVRWLRDQAELTFYGVTKRIYGAIQDITESKHNKEALQLAYSDLEHRVQLRTRELKESNKKLREEIRYREEAEEKLLFAKRHAEKANKAKTEFLANVSHELRTPMHHILNYSKYGITKFHKSSQEKLLHYFSQIRKTGDRLMLLLNDLLDLSKLETGNIAYIKDQIDLYQLVKERISELGTMLDKKHLTVHIQETKVESKLECDSNKIGQVIQNLMSNAIKFTPEGKNINIYFEPSVLSISTIEGTAEVVSAVSVFFGDQGIGIPERELEAVFDKFVQSSKTRTGAGGTGLGLSISKEIIEAHNGVIYAENNSDGGATFTFTLPYQQSNIKPWQNQLPIRD